MVASDFYNEIHLDHVLQGAYSSIPSRKSGFGDAVFGPETAGLS